MGCFFNIKKDNRHNNKHGKIDHQVCSLTYLDAEEKFNDIFWRNQSGY